MRDKWPDNIKGILESSHSEKSIDERLWDLSLLFLEGRQWLNFDDRLGRYAPVLPSAGDGLFRVTVNLLLNVYRNVLARLALAYPSVVVVPASPVHDDIIKAQTSEMALKYFWQSERVKYTLMHMIEWILTTGTAALHTYYDPGSKSVKLETFGAYDILFEEGVLDPKDSQWIALRSFYPRDELKRAYPDHAEEIANAISSDPSDEEIRPSLEQPGYPPNRIETHEIYWRDGRHAVVMGSEYLYKEEFPVDHFPVEIVRYSVIPRRCWGLSLLAPLLDLQTLYNKARTQLVHNIELMSNPKWLIPKTAGVATSAITNRVGEKVYYNPSGGAPTQVPAAPIPSHVIDNITRIQSEMGDVAGLHSVTLGKRAVGVTSGKAMETLASYDTSQLQGTQEEIERAVSGTAKCALMLMKYYYTEDKMIRMLDHAGRAAFKAISNTNLADDPEVFIEAGSLFRYEAQDRDARVIELLQLGLLDPKVAMDELSFRTGNSFISERVRGIAHATDILEAAKMGAEPQIYLSDDLEAFRKVFTEFMQSAEFYQLEDEQQDLISKMLVAINTVGMPPEAFSAAVQSQTVWPRPPAMPGPPGAMPMGAPQPLQALAPKQQQTGSGAAAERQTTNRSEALMTSTPGGGVL
jgi:hypothetical protein